MKKEKLLECFEALETMQEHNGYFCSISQAISIVVLGSVCGLRNASRIHQWAASILLDNGKNLTIALDGKTVRSTGAVSETQ